jgi:hypothetical protein
MKDKKLGFRVDTNLLTWLDLQTNDGYRTKTDIIVDKELKGYHTMKGFIYILSNEFMPDLIKIGYKEQKKLVQLLAFLLHLRLVIVLKLIILAKKKEKYMNSRVNGNREFFKLSEAINELINDNVYIGIQELERKVA